MTLKKRKIITLIVSAGLLVFVVLFHSPAQKLLDTIHEHWYQYSYFPSKSIASAPEAKGDPAIAVPILMYHGVRVVGELGDNTTRSEFIRQMEMLKREGYQTISVNEYDLFRQGEFELPPKPIILTFDDARKDSYYTVDIVLKKLGFKATNFVASVKQNVNDPFFLNWHELKKLQNTGRWELEAHGRHSHDVVVIDEKGTLGRYLSARIYNPVTGLESVDEFEKRVNDDYVDSLADLYTNLDIKARYYAIPLNDYGGQESNYEGGVAYNHMLTKKYFRFAFIESLTDDSGHAALETFYNYNDSNPYTLERLEVKSMTAEELWRSLEKFTPGKPNAEFPIKANYIDVDNMTHAVYGNIEEKSNELILKPVSQGSAARALLGDMGWKDYSVEAKITKGIAREASLIIYYQDEENMILIDWDESNLRVIERLAGTEKTIVSRDAFGERDESSTVFASVKDGSLKASFNGIQLLDEYHTDIPRGAPGFGVWDPDGNGIKLTTFSVTNLD